MQRWQMALVGGLMLGPLRTLAGDFADISFADAAVLEEATSLSTVGDAFMPNGDWPAQDVEALEARLHEAHTGPRDDESVFYAGTDTGPLVKALLTVVSEEAPLPHARYRLRYAMTHVVPEGAGGPLEVSLVEAARFNLGPTRRAELVETLGEEHVAPPEQFGIAPDVVWRLVMHPVQGQAAALAHVARRELEGTAEANCFVYVCREGGSINAKVRDWPEQAELSPRLAFETLEVALLDTAMQQLGIAVVDEQGHQHWQGFEWREPVPSGTPFVEAVIERGLGQEESVDLVIHDDQLMDHELRALWHRLVAVVVEPGAPPLVVGTQDPERRPRPERD